MAMLGHRSACHVLTVAAVLALLLGAAACNTKDDGKIVRGTGHNGDDGGHVEDTDGVADSGDVGDGGGADTSDVGSPDVDSPDSGEDSGPPPEGLTLESGRMSTVGARTGGTQSGLTLVEDGFAVGTRLCNGSVCVTGGIKP